MPIRAITGFPDLLDDRSRRQQRCSARRKHHPRDGYHITCIGDQVSLMSEPLTGTETTRHLAHRSTGLMHKELHTMKTINWSADNVQDSKKETQVSNGYRSPRVLPLGTAVELLQGSWSGGFTDSGQPPFRR
jgi:hypothetical protein